MSDHSENTLPLPDSLASRIREKLKSMVLTQKQPSDMTGTTRTRMSLIERGT